MARNFWALNAPILAVFCGVLRCWRWGVEHRLTKTRTPKTNGMVERFNGRIADVLKTNRFGSAQDMAQTRAPYMAPHNHQFSPSALKSKMPKQTMKDGHAIPTRLLHKRP
jgi:hypothetical protein